VGIANPVVVLGFRLFPAVFDVLVTPLVKVGALSRRPVPNHSGSVLAPIPEGEAEHGFWGRLGRRTEPTEAVSAAVDVDGAAAAVSEPHLKVVAQQPASAGGNP